MTRGMYGGEWIRVGPTGRPRWLWARVPQDFILGYFRLVPTGRLTARRIGATRLEVNRLTNLKHATKIDCFDAALRALGKRLYLDAA